MNLEKYKLNLEPSPIDGRDMLLETIYTEQVVLPEIWDLRGEMQPVRDQGEQGTCSAQTASAMKEWQEFKDIGVKGYMSPQFIYNLRENSKSSGMYPRNTMGILNKIGIVTEEDYSYNTTQKISNKLIKKAENFKIKGYAQINTIDSLKKALFANGPCYIAFPVYNINKMEFWLPDNKNQVMLGGHAVCVVGYLKDKFIIRNSWSNKWGDKGYTYFPFSQWGHQWECWTTIDENSNSDTLLTKIKKYKEKHNIFKKILKIFFK
jgi:C1A family cysteine protease